VWNSAERTLPAPPREEVDSRALFGQTMGLVAITVAFAALGAYLGRDASGLVSIVCWIAGFGCIIGLNVAAARSQQLAITLLFGLGLLIGIAMGSTVAAYAEAEPAAVWQAAGATALSVSGLGAFGYATKRDLSGLGRMLFWALLALIGFGLVLLFVSIPNENVIYSVLGLLVFGGLVVVDFNRLRRMGTAAAAVPMAAAIFLDVVNIFLFFLSLFGGGRRD
jgi:FtsH-binding integral membrane protein